MRKILLSFLLFALILPAFGQNQDEFKFSLVPRRVSVPSVTGFINQNGTVPLAADWNVGAFSLTVLNLTAAPTLGNTLLTNGDFTTDPTGTATPWMEGASTNIGTAWAWSSGKIRHATASATVLRQVISATTGQLLKVVFTIAQDGATPIAGTITVKVGGTGATGISDDITVAAGTYTRYLYAVGTSTYYLTFTPSTTFTATIDDVSCQLATNGDISGIDILASGQILPSIGTVQHPGIAWPGTNATTYDSGIYSVAGALNFSYNNVFAFSINSAAVSLRDNAMYLGWRGAGTKLYSDASYQLDFRNGTAASIFNIYGTYTSATSYERGFLRTTATAVEIGSEKGSGGGTARPVNFYTDGVLREQIDTSGNIAHLGANSQATNIRQATAVVTTTAAATATATNLIPAGAFVIGVTTRVTTAVTGDAGFTGINIGDGTDADMFGANVSPLVNATTGLTNSTITAPVINTSAAKSVVLTQVGGSTFVAGGVVRVTVHYFDLTAPNT
jgi:hypothetical protein